MNDAPDVDEYALTGNGKHAAQTVSIFPAHAEIRGELFGFKSRALAETFRDQICGTLQRAGHPALRGELCLAERGQTCVVFKYLGRAIVWTDGLTFDELKTWLAVTQQSMHALVEAVRPGELVPAIFENMFARVEDTKRRGACTKHSGPLLGASATFVIDDLVEKDAETASWNLADLERWYGEKRTSAQQSRCPEPDAPRKRGHSQTVMQGSSSGGKTYAAKQAAADAGAIIIGKSDAGRELRGSRWTLPFSLAELFGIRGERS